MLPSAPVSIRAWGLGDDLPWPWGRSADRTVHASASRGGHPWRTGSAVERWHWTLLLSACCRVDAGAQDDQGGTLSFAVSTDVTAFDPALAYDGISQEVVHLLFDSLITFDDSGAFVPALADLPVISADGLTYTFTIRPDVSFVRQGEIVRTMTADDVVASINRLLRPDVMPYPSPIGPSYLTAIVGAQAVLDGTAETATGVRALDDQTVEITLDQPDPRRAQHPRLELWRRGARRARRHRCRPHSGRTRSAPAPTRSSRTRRASARRSCAIPHYWQADMPKADAIDVRLLVPPDVQVAPGHVGRPRYRG